MAFSLRPTTRSISPTMKVTRCAGSPEGRLLLTLGVSGRPSDTGATSPDYRTVQRGGPPFNYPTNVALSPEGDIYVSDGYGNARIHRFSPDGRLLHSWGQPGAGPGQFNVPHGIAIDRQGIVLVADRENSRIQRFTPDGEFIDEWTRRGSALRHVHRSCRPYLCRRDRLSRRQVLRRCAAERQRRARERLLAARRGLGAHSVAEPIRARRAISGRLTTCGSIRVAIFMLARSTTRPAFGLGSSVPTVTRCKIHPHAGVRLLGEATGLAPAICPRRLPCAINFPTRQSGEGISTLISPGIAISPGCAGRRRDLGFRCAGNRRAARRSLLPLEGARHRVRDELRNDHTVVRATGIGREATVSTTGGMWCP